MKFSDPLLTAEGKTRASVSLRSLRMLWFNTGSLCNIACPHCFMESSPKNDDLAYLSFQEVLHYAKRARGIGQPLEEVGLTGGEPFMNPDIIPMLEGLVWMGLKVLVLTNALKPLENKLKDVERIHKAHPGLLTLRVSLDHFTAAKHDEERGLGNFDRTLTCLRRACDVGLSIHIAGRRLWGEKESEVRAGFAELFVQKSLPLDASSDLVVFPEMKAGDHSVPEITTDCWNILKLDPSSLMCASSRMVIKRKGAEKPTIVSCTLLPHDPHFDLGEELWQSLRPITLKHEHCSKFCVLGGASCAK